MKIIQWFKDFFKSKPDTRPVVKLFMQFKRVNCIGDIDYTLFVQNSDGVWVITRDDISSWFVNRAARNLKDSGYRVELGKG